MTKYRYATISTERQTVDAQVAGLTKAGGAKVFSETASGAQTDRKALAKTMKMLQAGDVLMIHGLIDWLDRRVTS
jgi:DNA invertase Pin-like site-specific DNA recombinase